MRSSVSLRAASTDATGASSAGSLWCFRLGFWLLTFSWGVLTLDKTRWEIKSIWLSASLLIPAMLLLLAAGASGWRKCREQLRGVSGFVFGVLLIWGCVTALRPLIDFEWTSARNAFGGRLFAFAWLVPACLVFGMDVAVLRQTLKEIVNQGRLGLVLFLVCQLPPVQLLGDFSLNWGCSAALIFWHYLPRGSRWIVLAGAFLNLFLVTIASARNEMLGHGLLLLAAGFVESQRPTPNRSTRQLAVVGLAGMFAVATYYVATHDWLPLVGTRVNNQVALLKQEFWMNTRADEGFNVYHDLLGDMSQTHLLIGRGALGKYNSAAATANRDRGREMSSFHREGERGTGERQVIECGYLQVILKGGVLMLALMLALAVPALWMGCFHSNNWFVRGFAFIVGAWLIEMFPYGLPAAFPRYVLFWIAIGVCLSPRLRRLSDYEVEKIFLPTEVGRSRSPRWKGRSKHVTRQGRGLRQPVLQSGAVGGSLPKCDVPRGTTARGVNAPLGGRHGDQDAE